MREIACAEAAHPHVRYLSGSAEAIPLPDVSVDYTLIFLAWHHVQDRAAAAREISRVTRPGGTLLLRAQFADHMPHLWWLDYFPRGHELDASLYEPLAVVQAVFEAADWHVTDFAKIDEPSAGTRADVLGRLRLQAQSIFEHFTAAELATGFGQLERAVAANPGEPVPAGASTLLTLVRR
jgi:SAM-dependent methyltransferase